MPEKNKDFFARRIQVWYRKQQENWYRTHRYPRQFYVLKEKCGNAPLTKEAIVKEHIASVLYRLLGIRTPETRIVINNEHEVVGLASAYIKGYKDYDKIITKHSPISAVDLLAQLDAASTQSERIEQYQKAVKSLPIAHRENLLVAAICLMDSDIIGASFTNIGAVWDPDKNQYEWVKIDPGSLDYNTDIEKFKTDICLENDILSKDFTSRVYNDPAFFMVRNLHLLEFFSGLDKARLKKSIEHLTYLSDDEIKRHVMREEYQAIVGEALLNDITTRIIERKQHLLSMLDLSKQAIASESTPLQTILAEKGLFSDPVHTIERGNAEPSIVYIKCDEDPPLHKKPVVTISL